MQGQMMDYQLTLTPLLDRARRLFPRVGTFHLRADDRTSGTPRQCLIQAGSQKRGPRSDLRLEQRAASRNLFCCAVYGRGSPSSQPAPAP